MKDPSSAAATTTRRLLAAALRPTATESTVHDRVALVDRAVAAFAETLTRWFGPYGYHALLVRALGETRAAHPVLAKVRPHSTLTPVLDGLAEAAASHGAGALLEGTAALLAAVVGLLGRVVGEEMALQLLERSMHNVDGSAIPRAGAHSPDTSSATGGATGGAAS